MNTLLPWALAVGIVTVRDVRVYNRPPVPSEFVATGVLFGTLTVLAQAQPQLATALAWGMLAAIVLRGTRAGPGGNRTTTPGGVTGRRVREQEPTTTGGK